MAPASPFPQHVIARKRDGHALTDAEIQAFVRGATDSSWEKYQLSAMLMAILLKGMTPAETAALTDAMMRSGSMADLSAVPGIKVDKHSTGGVGDKVSIPLAPMVAACGVPVPMISGRGLGHSGGTLDKLESIPGFRTGLSLAEFQSQIARIGCALIGQTSDLAPADRTLYALRDVTATVECIPLICASILSKKLAEGIDALVLDVKFGSGAFMKTVDQARELAEALVNVGRAGGKQVRALLTAMHEPLGRNVGNALEVEESIACLRGKGPPDLMEITLALGAHMLVLGGVSKDLSSANLKLKQAVDSGAAFKRFREIVASQGGDTAAIDNPALLPRASRTVSILSPKDGYVTRVDAMGIALAALDLGAGRSRAEDMIDPAVGVSHLVKTGERISRGAPLCLLHVNREERLANACDTIMGAISIGGKPPAHVPLVAGVIL